MYGQKRPDGAADLRERLQNQDSGLYHSFGSLPEPQLTRRFFRWTFLLLSISTNGNVNTTSKVGLYPRADPETLLAVAKTLFNGIAVHSPSDDAAEYRKFVSCVQRASDSLESDVSPQEMLAHAESAALYLRDHNLRASKRQRLQNDELRAIVRTLMKALEDLNVAGPARMKQLKEIARQVELATDAEALRHGKIHLSDSLTEVCKEAERQLSSFRSDLTKDSVTKLASRSTAEAALVAACASETPMCAVILVVDRLPLCNKRYGREAGDKVLQFFADSVRKALSPGEGLYRWTGPAILVLLPDEPDKVQVAVRKFIEQRLQLDFEAGPRTVLLNVDACWSVFPMMVDPRLLINKIDAFVG